jgi:hypothetical protein
VILATLLSVLGTSLAVTRGLAMASGNGLLLAYTMYLLSVFVHELGHAGMSERYGARPGVIAVRLAPVWPTFATDVTEAWRLPTRQRVAVGLGGVYLQLIVVGCYAVAYAVTGRPFLATAAVISLTSAAVSLSPLPGTDGGRALDDLFGSTNIGAAVRLRLMRAVARPRPQAAPRTKPKLRLDAATLAAHGGHRLLFGALLAGYLVRGGAQQLLELPDTVRRAVSGADVGPELIALLSVAAVLATSLLDRVVDSVGGTLSVLRTRSRGSG